ncbi:MAG: protein translocase subunit SecF [Chloroflexi bacterium]|nr:protein translocase subunit SecF [Chloroflexota bacterium]
MFSLVERRRYYFLFSGILITLGLATLIYSTVSTGSPVQLSIDFTGGTLFQLQFTEGVGEQEIRDTLATFELDDIVVQELEPIESEDADVPTYPDSSRWSVRTDELTEDEVDNILDTLDSTVAPLDREAIETSQVSSTVGAEVTQAAVIATIFASAVVLGFMWFSFRNVPHPFRYGICAITAMIHDILVMLSIMSIMGLLFDWQVDALFLTALLTVVGFSVQDTIVVFDRIRENIPRRRGESYELIVNRSVLETVHRSLATQLNAIFVMIAIILFGGETIRQFVVILLVGLTSGTYSSIFIAVPLLVAWSRGELPFVEGDVKE